jgi:hypothetical protein
MALIVISAVLWFGNAWWNSEAASYQQKVYKPLRMQAQLSDKGELLLNLNDPGWLTPLRRVDFRQVLFTRSVDDFVPDHNHLMHLYAIRQPGLDVVYHLHPELADRGRFRLRLPAMIRGEYKLYADVVHRNGFPETLVASVRVPAGLPARDLEGDDAAGQAAPYTETPATSTQFQLPDGYKMDWLRGTEDPRAKHAEVFRFRLTDPKGGAVRNMSFYMGMLGHAAFVKTDGSVFAHVHPAGSISMAAFSLAQQQTGDSTISKTTQPMLMDGTDMAGMDMPGMQHADGPQTDPLPNEVGFPYGFPSAGRYRIFAQMKHGHTVETGIFDADVKP